jgi:hypothetical protein
MPGLRSKQPVGAPHNGILLKKIDRNAQLVRCQNAWHGNVPAGSNECISANVGQYLPGTAYATTCGIRQLPQSAGRVEERCRFYKSNIQAVLMKDAFLHA